MENKVFGVNTKWYKDEFKKYYLFLLFFSFGPVITIMSLISNSYNDLLTILFFDGFFTFVLFYFLKVKKEYKLAKTGLIIGAKGIADKGNVLSWSEVSEVVLKTKMEQEDKKKLGRIALISFFLDFNAMNVELGYEETLSKSWVIKAIKKDGNFEIIQIWPNYLVYNIGEVVSEIEKYVPVRKSAIVLSQSKKQVKEYGDEKNGQKKNR